MTVLPPLSFFRGQKYFVFTMVFLILGMLGIILPYLDFRNQTLSCICLTAFWLFLLVYSPWWMYKDYQRKMKFIDTSGMMRYLSSNDLYLKENFTGWEHEVSIEGRFQGYDVHIDLHYNKGWVWREYYFTVSASVNTDFMHTIQWKPTRKKLRLQGVDLFPYVATVSENVRLNRKFIADKGFHETIINFIQTLKTNNISPL